MSALRAPAPGHESARRVLLLGVLGTLAIATIDLLLGGRLSMFFDLAFITLCLGLGLLPRPDASYGVAFVPPVVLVLAFSLIAAVDPTLVTHEAQGRGHAVMGGLSEHAGSLAVGYALCLAALGLRLAQSSKRLTSPAPTRITSG